MSRARICREVSFPLPRALIKFREGVSAARHLGATLAEVTQLRIRTSLIEFWGLNDLKSTWNRTWRTARALWVIFIIAEGQRERGRRGEEGKVGGREEGQVLEI